MKKLLLFFFFFLYACINTFSQTLLANIEFPRFNSYNYFWGITTINDTLWISSEFNSTSGTYQFSWMYKVTKEGAIVDSFQTPFTFSNGSEFDGENFWIGEQLRQAGSKIFQITPQGVKIDSFVIPSLFGGVQKGIGDLAKEGNGIWFSIYNPDFVDYPNAYAYKFDLTSRVITDTIPLRGRQVYGITVKGDTIFYVNDNNHGEPEKIYAYCRVAGDTVMSWSLPDPDGSMNPKGLHWDGEYLWMIAERIGGTAWVYKALYKYDIYGQGSPAITAVNSIVFNDVIIGQPKSIPLLISNTGDGNLILDSLILTNSFYSISPNNTPDTITPGETKTYSVTFDPSTFGNQEGELRIHNNSGALPLKLITLSGRGVHLNPWLGLSSSHLMFGGKRKNSTSYIELELINSGSQPLTVSSLALNSSNYYLENAETPFTIDSVKSKTIRVWFNPNVYDELKDTLTIESNNSTGAFSYVELSGTGTSYDSTLGAIMWQGNVPANPATSYQDYQIRVMAKIGDVSGDGVDDLIVCSRNYWTIAYNGNSSGTGDILWMFSTIPNNNNAGSVEWVQLLKPGPDLNNDGIPDVVIGTTGGNEFVYALNGATGEKLWEFGDSINWDNGDIMGLDVKRDWNGDGIPDVLATASGNESTGSGRYSIYLLNGVDGSVIWQINQSPQKKLKYMVASTDDGGAFGSRAGSVNEVIGFNKQGTISWSFPTLAAPWAVKEIEDIGGEPTSDIIAGDIGGRVYAITGDAGIQLWQTSTGGFIEDLIIVPDVDGDRVDDILVSQLNSNLYLLSGKTGAVIWLQNAGGTILVAEMFGDLNADGIPEVASGTLTANKVDVFDGKTGSTLFSYHFGSGSSNAVDALSIMGDLDGNGTYEFAAGSRGGRVIAFSGGYDVPTFSDENFIPLEYKLEQNYPNPFNPSTIISYSIPEAAKIKITIFDILGRVVKTLINEDHSPGNYQAEWNGKNELNNKISSGVYFYQISAEGLSGVKFRDIKKMILLK
jgi:hypothetical protein